jgi:hypothetical protein
MAQSLASAAEHIRDAVRWLAEREAELKMLNFEIREYRIKHIKGDLGFKIADWNAIYRVSQLEVEDRDALVDTLREGFAALGIGQIVDWVDAAQATPRRAANGQAAPDEAARAWGRSDGLGGVHDHADDYPPGEPGHGDYMLGLADGEEEAARIQALGNGAAAPKRRGRPRKQQQEAEADAEF